MRRALVAAGILLACLAPIAAQDVSGTAFEDRNGDGIRGAGEPALEGVRVELYGQSDGSGSVDTSVVTGTDGAYSFAPGNGCYLLLPTDPVGWRMSSTRDDLYQEGTGGYVHPVGRSRFSKLDQGLGRLRTGALSYASMGDSIAWNWNVCGYEETFWYSRQVRARMQCAAPLATIPLDEAAVKGEHTDDLLVDDTDDNNNVFRVMETLPDLITISMIGNDMLGVDVDNPTQQEVNRAVAEVLDARQNFQEAISVMLSEVPGADITLNTLYDDRAWNCYGGTPTTSFHRAWLPIVNRILRDLAWGQARRVSINEVAAEFAQEDQIGACSGFDGQICRDFLQLDMIHPRNEGYEIIREKVWEAVGGVNLGTRDTLGRTSMTGADYGFLRKVRRLHATSWEERDGASVVDPDAALDGNDAGAAASITLGAGTEEFRLTGFPDWYDEVQIVRVIAGVRFRTAGTVADDFYRMEASVAGQFRPPPGHDYTPTDWNYYTPIVGGGGPNQPPENPDFPNARLLALPDVATYREASATLTKDPELPPGAAHYVWPAITHEELATTAVRVAAAPVAGTPGNDNYTVELDAGWLDLYGWEKERPSEVGGLRASILGDGSLEVSFEDLADATRYNLYFGRMDTLRTGVYDHGADAPAGPDCDASTEAIGGGRSRVVVAPGSQPAGDAYFLVTAHVDDVESPAGTSSNGAEVDRSQSICR
jgi:hypothetical protein